jgi:hypothetical protein
MNYTYATLKDGRLFLKDRSEFRSYYLAMQGRQPVNVRVRIEEILTGKEEAIYGIVFRDKMEYDLKELQAKLKTFTNPDVRVWVEKVYGKHGMSQEQYYRSVVLFEFVWGYYDTHKEFITNDYADQLLKLAVIPIIVKDESGNTEKIAGSTKDYDTMQYDLFLDKCRGFIKQYFDRKVPMPERMDEREFNF